MEIPTIRTIEAVRYVTPLREGGSLPAIVEGDDDGLYVLKFRGAGQGPKALVAELVVGEIARALGLRVPEIVFVDLEVAMGRTEPDEEIQDLIRASVGTNLGLDYLPGSVTFDPLAMRPDAGLASSIVWLDALATNVDRTARNTNMLIWHGDLWLIDHGAALYAHHAGPNFAERARAPFPLVKDHVLLPFASEIESADERLAARLTPEIVTAIAEQIPAVWLDGDERPDHVAARRAAYAEYLLARLAGPRTFVEEARDARAAL